MTKRLALLGASGHGKVIADIAQANGFKDIVFFDDRWQEINELCGTPVVGSLAQAIANPGTYDYVYVCIGNASTRARIQEGLRNIGPALIHPSACISASVEIDVGTVIMPNAVVNADTKIGKGVIVNTGSVIEHDCIIDDYAHICPNASLAGGVKVGGGAWIGIGSAVIQLCSIGSQATVGAGSVVIGDVQDGETVVGNPAKHLHR